MRNQRQSRDYGPEPVSRVRPAIPRQDQATAQERDARRMWSREAGYTHAEPYVWKSVVRIQLNPAQGNIFETTGVTWRYFISGATMDVHIHPGANKRFTEH